MDNEEKSQVYRAAIINRPPLPIVGYQSLSGLESGHYNIIIGEYTRLDLTNSPGLNLDNLIIDCPDPASYSKSRFVCRRCKYLETCKPSRKGH